VKVDAFYENILIGDVHADLSCCRKIALEHEQKGDSDQDDGDESEDSDGGDGGPPENLDISQDDKILTNEDEFSDVEEDVLNLIDEMLDNRHYLHFHHRHPDQNPPFAGAPKQFSYNMTSLHVHLQLKCSHKMHRLSQDAV
jgi:hypothetical protein